jgi:hypothetical protein
VADQKRSHHRETLMAADGRCATCEHYEPPDDLDVRSGHTFGVCAMAYSEDTAEHSESLAVAYDHEGYRAWLRVSPDFGCVQWREKPDAAPRS